MDATAAMLLALSHAADYQQAGRRLDRGAQMEIVDKVLLLENAQDARDIRDESLRRAFPHSGYHVSTLSDSAKLFAANKWPSWRWSAKPPDGTAPLLRALFDVCRAASAMGVNGGVSLPDERRIRQIVQSGS